MCVCVCVCVRVCVCACACKSESRSYMSGTSLYTQTTYRIRVSISHNYTNLSYQRLMDKNTFDNDKAPHIYVQAYISFHLCPWNDKINQVFVDKSFTFR